MTCVYCGAIHEVRARCTRGHFVCDACHARDARAVIRQACLAADATDPVALFDLVVAHPSVKMHGPEHHFLVPAVLLAAYYNHLDQPERKREALGEADARSKHILGGFCGFHGNCGAGVGAGTFVSIVTGATPLSTRAWSWANELTGRCLLRIAKHGGPRCCKRNSYLALLEAVAFLEERMEVSLPVARAVRCTMSERNHECLGARCPFHASQAPA